MECVKIEQTQKVIPVIVGEWCICNKYADKIKNSADQNNDNAQKQKERYRWIYALQKQAWEKGAGWFYWNYQLLRDREETVDETWKESWDICRCFKNQWIPERVDAEPTSVRKLKGTGEK